MTILLILPQHHILVLDGGDLPAGVGPDLGAAHVQGDDEQAQRDLGPQVQGAELAVQGSDEAEDDHEELEQRNRHDDKVDSKGMNFLIDFTPCIDKCQIVSVHEMFEDEVKKTKRGD